MFYFVLIDVFLFFILIAITWLIIGSYRHINYNIPIINARMTLQFFIHSLENDSSKQEAINLLSNQKYHKNWAIVITKIKEGYEWNEAIEFFKNRNKNPYVNEIASILQGQDTLEKLKELKKYILDEEIPVYKCGDLTGKRFL